MFATFILKKPNFAFVLEIMLTVATWLFKNCFSIEFLLLFSSINTLGDDWSQNGAAM